MPPRPSPTHFLCIPLVTGASRHQLSASIGSFKADVTSPDSFGIPEQAVRPVGTIHLTLGVMSFPRNENLEQAVSFLKTLTPRQILAASVVNNAATATITTTTTTTTAAAAAAASDPAPPKAVESSSGPPLLSVTLRGLHSMQQPSKAAVLYTSPVDQDGALLRFCEHLRSAFQKAGLMMMSAEEDRPLLLHATIMNTIYVRGRRDRVRGGGGGGGHNNNNNNNNRGNKRNERLTVDARPIIDRYDDFVWMEDVPVEKIAICKMGARKLDDGDEAYEVEAEIDFA